MSKRFDGINPAATNKLVMRLICLQEYTVTTPLVSDWLVIAIERPLDRGHSQDRIISYTV